MVKRNQRFTSIFVVLLLVVSLLAGCGAAPVQTPAASSPGDAQASTPADTTQASTPVAEAPKEPLGKYEPAVPVRVVNATDSTVQYLDGESADNNAWINEYRDVLGVEIEYDWIVDAQQYTQKMNVTIASGNLPDMFPVNGQQMNMLMDVDGIEDLTEVYDQYISEQALGIINQDEKVFELGRRGGKLFALPNTGGSSALDSPAMLYVREDWRKKLNLPEPRTMDDFYKLAEAFVTMDPNGNGTQDTYAFALTKSLARGDAGTGFQGFAGLQGFANAYHAYLSTWIRDDAGTIVYGSIQPEVRTMLLQLQEMYGKGWLDREFAVKDSAKVSESLVNGTIGMQFGLMWNPFYPLVTTLENNPEAEWQPYPLPSIDDAPAMPSTSVSAAAYWVVRKGFEHPEAAIKMLNLFTERCWGETADNVKFFNGDGGRSPFKFSLIQAWPAMKNINAHKAVVEALKTSDPSKLDGEQMNYYNQALAYKASGVPADGWGANKIFGENSSFTVISQYQDKGLYLYDEYHNIPTETMVERLSTLDQMENEVFTKIIMGAADISEFDKFVEDWKRLGGDDITTELNAR